MIMLHQRSNSKKIDPRLLGKIHAVLEKTDFPPINFKLKQLECLSELLIGHDVIGVLPTGFGKSLIYQLLPMILPTKNKRNIILVVAPLSSIIIDQETILEKRGIRFFDRLYIPKNVVA